MLVLEFKTYRKVGQFSAIDEAIRTVQFIRNKCIRYWMDNKGSGQATLQRLCATLANQFPFAKELNSMARQASAERAWSAISRFYENWKSPAIKKKGYPQFQKDNRSVEYKTSGWTLSDDRKAITFTDNKGIGRLKLKGTRDLHFYGKNGERDPSKGCRSRYCLTRARRLNESGWLGGLMGTMCNFVSGLIVKRKLSHRVRLSV